MHSCLYEFVAVYLFHTQLALILTLLQTMPWPYLLYPQFSFCRAVYLLNFACINDFQCYPQVWTVSLSDELTMDIVALYLSGIVYFILGTYLDLGNWFFTVCCCSEVKNFPVVFSFYYFC